MNSLQFSIWTKGIYEVELARACKMSLLEEAAPDAPGFVVDFFMDGKMPSRGGGSKLESEIFL